VAAAARRATGLSNQMLSYAGRGTYALQAIDINELLRDSESLLHLSIPSGVSFKLELTGGLPPTLADASQLQQALVNLVANAAESFEGRQTGTITITTGARECDRKCMDGAFLYGDVREGEHVFFAVKDTGEGMDSATRARIFDPFFSTRHTGRGLGMAAVLGIVRGHGGMLRIDSAPGEGTTVTVLLPQAEKTGAGQENAVPPSTGGAGHKVLVVDDEEIVLDVTRQMIERLGLEPLAARSGREALETYDRHSEDIAVVILDLVMPEMDGSQVFRELRARNENVEIVLCSGYNEERVADQLGDQEPSAFVQKPFDFPTLKGAIERVMGTLSAS